VGAEKCSECSNDAARRCTECGSVFCDLHLRLGNPRRGWADRMRGADGYYCDSCWFGVARRSRAELAVFVLVLATLMVVAAVAFVHQMGR